MEFKLNYFIFKTVLCSCKYGNQHFSQILENLNLRHYFFCLDEILKRIEEAGFEIALQKEIQLSREQAENFYKEHMEQPYFEELIAKMTG